MVVVSRKSVHQPYYRVVINSDVKRPGRGQREEHEENSLFLTEKGILNRS